MSFWNFIGLVSKKDIINLNKQLENIQNLKEENIKSQQVLCDELSKINLYISKLEQNNKINIANINDMLQTISQNIVEIKNTGVANTRNLSKAVSYIQGDINNLKTEFNEEINNFKNENIKGHQIVFDILEKIGVQISKFNEENYNHIDDSNAILKGICNDLIELKIKTIDIDNILNNKITKQITKDIRYSQKQMDILNKEVSITQEMLKTLWVNDIIDTLENQITTGI